MAQPEPHEDSGEKQPAQLRGLQTKGRPSICPSGTSSASLHPATTDKCRANSTAVGAAAGKGFGREKAQSRLYVDLVGTGLSPSPSAQTPGDRAPPLPVIQGSSWDKQGGWFKGCPDHPPSSHPPTVVDLGQRGRGWGGQAGCELPSTMVSISPGRTGPPTRPPPGTPSKMGTRRIRNQSTSLLSPSPTLTCSGQ